LLACKTSAGLHSFILWLVFGSGYTGSADARFLLCVGCLRPEQIWLCTGLVLCKSRSRAWSTSLLTGLVSPARFCLWCLRVQFFCCLSQSRVPAPDKATASGPVKSAPLPFSPLADFGPVFFSGIVNLCSICLSAVARLRFAGL
jgi:hypothetical protein